MKLLNLEIKAKEIFFFVLILLGASFFRFYNLNQLPVFADEAIYIRWAQVMKAESTLRFLPLSDGKQPLFMWSVIPFFKLFSDPLIAGRILSGITGLGTLVGVWMATYLLFKSKKSAFIASILYAMSPFAVFFDRIALVDSMLAMYAIWVFVFGLMTVQIKRLDAALITGFALGGALLTKSPAIYFALLLPSITILTLKDKLKNNFQRIVLLLVSLGVGYGFYNILRLGPNFHMIAQRNGDYVYPISHILSDPFNPLVSHARAVIEYFSQLGPSSLLALMLVSAIYIFPKKPREITLLIIWIILPLFSSLMFSKTMTARYILFSIPFISVLAASIFSAKDRSVMLISKGLLAIFIAISLVINIRQLTNIRAMPLPRSERSGYLEEWTSGYGIKEVAEYIIKKHNSNPSLPILIGTEGYFGTLPDGLMIYLNNYPQITVIGVGLDLKKIPESLANTKRAGTDTYLVINNTRIQIPDFKSSGLELINEYEKASKPDDSPLPTEKLLFFRL